MLENKRFDTKPLYIQVQEELSSRILNGAYSPGAPLPNEWVLSNELGVSIGTLRKAVQGLVDNQLLARIAGRGTLVTDRQSRHYKSSFERYRDVEGHPAHWTYKLLHLEQAPANGVEAERLEIPEGACVTRFRRTRAFQGRVVIYEEITVPSTRIHVPEGVSAEQTTADALAEANGRAVGWINKKFYYGSPPPAAAEHMDKDEGAPLLTGERLTYDSDGVAIEYSYGVVNLRHLRYHVEIYPGRAPRRG